MSKNPFKFYSRTTATCDFLIGSTLGIFAIGLLWFYLYTS